MAIFKKPDQNLQFNIPDIGQVFRATGGDPSNIYKREGNEIIVMNIDTLGESKGAKPGRASTVRGGEALSEVGINFSSLPEFNIGDVTTAFGFINPQSEFVRARTQGGGQSVQDISRFIQKEVTQAPEFTVPVDPVLQSALGKAKAQGTSIAQANIFPERTKEAEKRRQEQIATIPKTPQIQLTKNSPDTISDVSVATRTAKALGYNTIEEASRALGVPAESLIKNVNIGVTLPIDPKQQEIESITETGNKNQESDFDIISSTIGEGVDVKDSTKLIEALLDIYKKDEEKPEEPSLVEQFNEKRKELGIEPLETELADIDAEIERINTNLLVEAERAGERLVSMAQIGRTRGKLQKEAEQRIALLNVERSAIARQLNNKISTLNTVMNLTQQDFSNASTAYSQEFNRNLQMIDLVLGIENREQAEAQANLNTIVNLAKNSGKSFADLTPSQQLSINNLELQAGLPVGTVGTFMTSKPTAEIITNGRSTDANGNEFAWIMSKEGDNPPEIVRVGATGGFKETTETTMEEERTTFNDAVAFVQEHKDTSTFEQLKLALQRDSDLNDGEINNILASEGVVKEKEETPMSDELMDAYATEIVNAVKSFWKEKGKEFENAKILIEKNKIKKNWSDKQTETITQKVKDKLKIKE